MNCLLYLLSYSEMKRCAILTLFSVKVVLHQHTKHFIQKERKETCN